MTFFPCLYCTQRFFSCFLHTLGVFLSLSIAVCFLDIWFTDRKEFYRFSSSYMMFYSVQFFATCLFITAHELDLCSFTCLSVIAAFQRLFCFCDMGSHRYLFYSILCLYTRFSNSISQLIASRPSPIVHYPPSNKNTSLVSNIRGYGNVRDELYLYGFCSWLLVFGFWFLVFGFWRQGYSANTLILNKKIERCV
jgi:hypothetical protein